MDEQRLIDANKLSKNIKAYFGRCLDSHDSEIIDDYCKEILKHNKNISKIIKEAPTVESPRDEYKEKTMTICGTTGLPCIYCNGGCNSRKEMREMTPEESKNYSKALDDLYTPTKQNIFNMKGEGE